MKRKSLSSIIEDYLKQVLEEKNEIEIRRSEIAELFNCVPSQINYVIDTRFTIKQGYIVESKRGGGGYIRIKEVNLLDDTQILDTMIDTIGTELTEREGKAIIENLYAEDVIKKDEAKIMHVAMDKSNYNGAGSLENKIRARLLKKFLMTYKYKD